jgi:hypothetical protein
VTLGQPLNHVYDECISNHLQQRSFRRLLAAVINNRSTDARVPKDEYQTSQSPKFDEKMFKTHTPIKYGLTLSTDSRFPAGTHVKIPAFAILGSPKTARSVSSRPCLPPPRQHRKRHTRHRNKFSPSGKHFCYQLCGRLWRDGRTFNKQLPLDILFEDLLEGSEYGILIAEARPDNVGLCDGLGQGRDNDAVRDVGMVRLGVGGGAGPQHNGLFETAFGGKVIAHGLRGDIRGCNEVEDWGGNRYSAHVAQTEPRKGRCHYCWRDSG